MNTCQLFHLLDISDVFKRIVSLYDPDRAACVTIMLTRRAKWSEFNERIMRDLIDSCKLNMPGLAIYFVVVAPPMSKDQIMSYKQFTNVSYAHACQNYGITLVTCVDHTTMLQLIPQISQFAEVW